MSNSSSSSGGVGLASLLTVLFVGLKLTHVIDWSWWWVLSPLWISAGVGIVVVAGLLLVLAVTDK
jgi:hypothetical protein